MCWSGEASFGLAAVGLAATGYAAWKKESPLLWTPLAYFSLMELLQGFTYSVIDECALPSNQIATLLGYLHIVFQPFFGCLMALYFVPDRVRKAYMPYAMAICSVSSLVMLIQLYPFDWTGNCTSGERALCGPELCSITGDWHIAWLVPVNDLFENLIAPTKGTLIEGIFIDGFPTYPIAMFVVPLLMGSWRLTIYHFVMGPTLAQMTTSNPNEIPAVWCLLSIGFLLLVIKTPLRNWMHVRRWPLWRLIPEEPPVAAKAAAPLPAPAGE